MLTQRALLLVACAWTVSSCMPRPAGVPAPVEPGPGVTLEIPADAERLPVDPDASVVTVLVRRAGPLARFGHNHVIVSSAESGLAWVGSDLAHSGFEVRLPVAGFVVDDGGARAAAGPEFGGSVPEDAREATYANLLRPEVLDGARHPEVVVGASRVGGTWERPVVVARVTLRGVTRDVELPIELRRGPAGLTASGALTIRQTDFGITPFSVGGGAVQVADELEIRFEIAASRN